MSKLAILGGQPVVENILEKSQLIWRRDLERKYLLEAYDSEVWDDWPERMDSMAAKFQLEWAKFSKSKFCALLTNGTRATTRGMPSM